MPLHVPNTMYSSSGGQNTVGGRHVHRWGESSPNPCTERPPTGVTIPDAV